MCKVLKFISKNPFLIGIFLLFIFISMAFWKQRILIILNAVVVCILLLIIYKKPKRRRQLIMKTAFLFFFGWLTFVSFILFGNAAHLALTVAFWLWASNINKMFHMQMKTVDIAMIVLTVVILQATWPLLHPRLEIVDVGEPHTGFVFVENNQYSTYGLSRFTIQVTPPLIPLGFWSFSCSEEHLGKQINILQPADGLNAEEIKSGTLRVCSNSLNLNKKIILVDVFLPYAVKFNSHGSNITEFVEYEKGGARYYHSNLMLENYGTFKIIVRGIYATIFNTTSAWNTTLKVLNTTECGDNDFSLKDTITAPISHNIDFNISNESIVLSREHWLELEPEEIKHLKFVLTDFRCNESEPGWD